jgi:hypothetical protein
MGSEEVFPGKQAIILLFIPDKNGNFYKLKFKSHEKDNINYRPAFIQ